MFGKEKKPFEGVKFEYLRKRHHNPSEWVGMTIAGVFVYILATPSKLHYKTGKVMADVLRSVVKKQHSSITNKSVHGKKANTDEMAEMLGIAMPEGD